MAADDHDRMKKSASASAVAPGEAEPGAAAEGADAAEAPATGQAARDDGDPRFPIVGLGASAGGLVALEEFFFTMPSDSGMAFVVVTHQHRTHPSMLADLLGRKTAMPVVRVAGATGVRPDHVYTAEPGYDLALLEGVLQPMEAAAQATPRMPIDYFFRSLARDQKAYAIGIILSGMGTDGSIGLTEIKRKRGMVMVQAPQRHRDRAGRPRAARVQDAPPARGSCRGDAGASQPRRDTICNGRRGAAAALRLDPRPHRARLLTIQAEHGQPSTRAPHAPAAPHQGGRLCAPHPIQSRRDRPLV
jgi:chemotaxis response regulator CheB